MDRFTKAFRRAVRSAEQNEWLYGILGRLNGDASVTIIAPRPGWVYVRMGEQGAGDLTMARNIGGVPLVANLAVRLRREYGELRLYAADANSPDATDYLAAYGAGVMQLSPLSETERDELTPRDGQTLYNTTADTVQARIAGAWMDWFDGDRLLRWSQAGITGTPVTVIPNGDGDVTTMIVYMLAGNDGTNTASIAQANAPGTYYDLTVGGNVLRLTVNGDGSVVMQRQSGSDALTALLVAGWL